MPLEALRFTDAQKQVLRFGFIIVDDKRRGQGLGREMLRLALDFAFHILRVRKVTLGVFDGNAPAYRCYERLGFTEVSREVWKVCGETYTCIELETEHP